MEAGKFDFVEEAFDLRDLTDKVVRSLGLRAHQKGLELTAHLPFSVPTARVGDPARLRQVLENVSRVLRAAGYDSSQVVSATVYLTDMKEYAAMNLVYGGYFEEGNYPARVAVEVAALPRGANVEIAVIAHQARRTP